MRPGQTQPVVTSRSKAVNHQSPLSAECVCVRVCVFVGLLTGRTVSDAVVFAVPVPQQQGGVPRARQDVAVAADVGLGASQTRHHVAVAEHDLGQLACKSATDTRIHTLVSVKEICIDKEILCWSLSFF